MKAPKHPLKFELLKNLVLHWKLSIHVEQIIYFILLTVIIVLYNNSIAYIIHIKYSE